MLSKEIMKKIDKIVDNITLEEIDKRIQADAMLSKENDIIYEEVDSKEVNDALHMLLHCSLKDTEYETQKEQFELIDYYIKQLEEENIHWKAQYYLLSRKIDVIPKSKVKGIIEQLDERIKNPERTSYWASYTISECIGIRRILQDILGKE